MVTKSFTIHFATINTNNISKVNKKYFKFTIHFATINTSIIKQLDIINQEFTIHFATINTVITFEDIYVIPKINIKVGSFY